MRWPWNKKRAITASTGPRRGSINNISEMKGITAEKQPWTDLRPHPENLSKYESFYKNDSEVHSAVNVLADMWVGIGYYTECENEQAKQIVDDMAEDVGLDQILLNVAKNMLVYGFCAVELFFKRGPPIGNIQLKVLPSPTMYMKKEKKGKLLGYVQNLGGGQASVTFNPREIIWFVYNQMGTDPYGTSIVAPILGLLEARENFHEDMPKIIHRYASPLTVWQTSGDESPVKDAVTKREPDEDIFIGGVEEGELQFETVKLDPRGRFVDYINNIDEGILEGLVAPILRYLRQTTEASSKTILDVIDRHIQGLQRYMKRMVEREIFEPLLALHGISDVPKLMWGSAKTGVEELDLRDIAELVNTGAISPSQAQDLLRKLGLPLEEPEEEPPNVEKAYKYLAKILLTA